MVHQAVRDECRRQVAARGLTPAAVTHLIQDALGRIDLSVLAPVKGLLKRFFSADAWAAADDDELADLVGAGDGWWTHELAPDLGLEYGWRGGRFRLDVVPAPQPVLVGVAESFEQPVVPEATPNPRTIRFVTGPIHDGPSRWYESATTVDDPRVARLFGAFADVVNVLVGPDFVAVGLRRPDRWEALLVPMLHAVASEFVAKSDAAAPVGAGSVSPGTDEPEPAWLRPDAVQESADGRVTSFERAWRELGRLRPDQPDALVQILAAVTSPDAAFRQVAARVISDASPDVAQAGWEKLLGDTSRTVRRAAVDAIVDAERSALRPLLERALGDPDAWIRWKAISGLTGIGIVPSRVVVSPLMTDADFRVRLEATAAMRRDA